MTRKAKYKPATAKKKSRIVVGRWKNISRTYMSILKLSSTKKKKKSAIHLFFQSVWRIFFSWLGAPYTSQRNKTDHAELLWGWENTLLKRPKQEHDHIQVKGTWMFWTSADLRPPSTFACVSERCGHRELLSRWPKDYIPAKSSTWLRSWSLTTLQQNLHPYTKANKMPWRGCGKN